MQKKGQQKKPNNPKAAPVSKPAAVQASARENTLPWLLIILGITGICLFPMLKNNFTNWDDEFYVINNVLLRGPDWQGIFSQPLVGNYHPLTVASLAINY